MRPNRMHHLGASLALSVLALAPSLAHAGSVTDRILRREQITIGYRTDAPPFSLHNAKGQPVGYSVDLCRGIAERIKTDLGKPTLKLRFVPVEADQLARLVSSGSVDLMCAGTSDTEERRKSMDFSPTVFVSSVKFMVRSKDNRSQAAQLKGQGVAVLGRTTAEPAVQAFSSQQGLDLKISRVVSPEAALSQLHLGQVGAYARDEVLLLSQLTRLPLDGQYMLLPESLSSERIAIAMPRGDAELRKSVEQGLAELVRSGQLEASYKQWFIDPLPGRKAGLGLPMPPELKAELDRLK